MLKKVIYFLSIVFALALVAKTIIFVLAIMGGAKLDAECVQWLIELGISWLVVLVGAVAFVFKLFEPPKTIRVPFPFPFPVRDGDDEDKPEDDSEKPEDDSEEKPESTEDKPESTEDKPESTEDKPE